MKLKLHHINLATTNVDAMDHFYRDVLGLERETEGLPTLEKKKVMPAMWLLFQMARSRCIWQPAILVQAFEQGKSSIPWRQGILPIGQMI